MNGTTYRAIEDYMRGMMTDSAHDIHHIYRVLYLALDIARSEPAADTDVLIAAALLHDIGRAAQAEDPTLCHAREGAKLAREYLLREGFDAAYAEHVANCIRTHRYRSNDAPASIEAKILFDADKLEAAGAMGIARSLIYQGQENLPLYNVDADGNVLDGTENIEDYPESLFMEYRRKLSRIGELFYTDAARDMAARRGDIAERIYRALLEETVTPTVAGKALLEKILDADA